MIPRAATVMIQLKRFNRIDQFEFHHVLAEADGINIVFFASRGCAACRYWTELLKRYTQRRLDVRVFEIDAEREAALTEEFGIFHLPSLFLYIDGRFHCALQSEATIDKLDTAVEAALASPPEEMP